MENTKILKKSKFKANEKELAKDYWANINFKGYELEKPWSKFIAARVMEYNPERVLEFGCNAGKNLIAINNLSSSVHTFGIDINRKAIQFAKDEYGLNVACTDESVLSIIPDNTYDIAYTVSVLDHVPHPEKILSHLLRISKKAVFLLEPWVGEEGKVVENFNLQSGSIVTTTPYSYSWDYKSMINEYKNDWTLNIEEHKLDSNLGRFYYLYHIQAKK